MTILPGLEPGEERTQSKGNQCHAELVKMGF